MVQAYTLPRGALRFRMPEIPRCSDWVPSFRVSSSLPFALRWKSSPVERPVALGCPTIFVLIWPISEIGNALEVSANSNLRGLVIELMPESAATYEGGQKATN